eukprot:4995828-Amphidinium_carterae.2
MIIWTNVCPSNIPWRTSSQVILYQEPLRRKSPSTRHCKRYVTTYKGKWRNLGTLRKQECKPKAKKKQKGGALPAIPPGSLTHGRNKEPREKPRLDDRPDLPPDDMLADLPAQVEREFGDTWAEASTSATTQPWEVLRLYVTASAAANAEAASSEPTCMLARRQEQLVCFHCLPVVVRDAVKQCGLGCGCFFSVKGIRMTGPYEVKLSKCAVLPTPNKSQERLPRGLVLQFFQAATTRNVAVSGPPISGMLTGGSAAEHCECSALLAGQ